MLDRAPDGAHVRGKMNLSSHGKKYQEALGHFDGELHTTEKAWLRYPEGVYNLVRFVGIKGDADFA